MLTEKRSEIKLIILDIDGVMTDGSKMYGTDGKVIAKKYNDKDFTAIKRFRAAKIPVCFLSGDNRINKKMAKNRNIDFYYSRGKDKASFVKDFQSKYGASPQQMLYVGDDLFDLSILRTVGYSFCPNDAISAVKETCGHRGVIPCEGGKNTIAALYDLLLDRRLIKEATIKNIEA